MSEGAIGDTVAELRELIVRQRSLPPRLGNKLAPRIRELQKELAATREGRTALSAMMVDPDVGVRLAAATWSLQWDEKRAIKVLEQVMLEKTLDAVTAKYTLKGHREGAIDYD